MTLLLHDLRHYSRAKGDARRVSLTRQQLAGIFLRLTTFLLLCGTLAGAIALKTAIYVSRLTHGAG